MRAKNIAWAFALYVTAIAAMYGYPVYEGTGAGTVFTEVGRHRGSATYHIGRGSSAVIQGGGALALSRSGDPSKGGSRL